MEAADPKTGRRAQPPMHHEAHSMYTAPRITNPATFSDALDVIDDLRARNAELEKLLGQVWEAPRCLGLTPTENALLGALVAANRTLSAGAIYTIMYGNRVDPPEPNILNVLLHRVRRKLAGYSINITNRWKHGYEIPAESRERLDALYQPGEKL
jgi:DNA-binding response OmpR family regulator